MADQYPSSTVLKDCFHYIMFSLKALVGDIKRQSLPSNDLKFNYADKHNTVLDLKSRFLFTKQPHVSVLCWFNLEPKNCQKLKDMSSSHQPFSFPWCQFMTVPCPHDFHVARSCAQIVFKCKKSESLFKAPFWFFTSMNLDLVHD